MSTPEPKRHAFPNPAFSHGAHFALTPPTLQQGASDGALPSGPPPPHFSLPLQTAQGATHGGGIPFGFGPTQQVPAAAGVPFGFEQQEGAPPAGIPLGVPRPIA